MEGKKTDAIAVKEPEMIETWLRKHTEIYHAAIKHPFILSIRDGSVDLSAFKRWLGQDYLFVREFVPFVASVLVKAWKESDAGEVEVILGGLASLNDEIAWFKREVSEWGIVLTSVVPLKANLEYRSFLESLMGGEVEYTVAVTAFWAIEAVYQESFAHCLEDGSATPEELKETCRRWGNESFGQYCRALLDLANRRLEKASASVRARAEVVLLRVLEHEIEFWNMSRGEA